MCPYALQPRDIIRRRVRQLRREAAAASSMTILRAVVRAVALAGGVLLLFHASPSAARRASIVVTNGAVVTMDAGRPIMGRGAVAIDGDSIVGVDTPDAIEKEFTADQRIDATNHIVLPGLIHTHTHAPMVMYRGLADDRALMEWLQNYVFPAEAKTVSPAFVRAGTRLAVPR